MVSLIFWFSSSSPLSSWAVWYEAPSSGVLPKRRQLDRVRGTGRSPGNHCGDEVISDEVKHNYQNHYQLQDNCHLILWEIRKGKCELVGCCWHDWRRFHNFLMVTQWRSQQWWRWWWAPGSRPRRQRQRTCSKIGRGWVSTPRKGCPSSSARGTSWWWSQIQRW